MESVDEGLCFMWYKLWMLMDKLTRKPEALVPWEAVNGLWLSVWAAFATTYKDERQGLLPTAWRSLRHWPGEGWRKIQRLSIGAGQTVQHL